MAEKVTIQDFEKWKVRQLKKQIKALECQLENARRLLASLENRDG